MSIVYRKSDKIKIAVDNIEIYVSPLSYHDKNKIQSLLLKGNVDSMMEGGTLALKCAIKDVKGLKLSDGSEYRLEFEDGQLSDDSLDDLMNLECNSKISLICLALINGIPEEFLDPKTQEVVEGVNIVKSGAQEKKE